MAEEENNDIEPEDHYDIEDPYEVDIEEPEEPSEDVVETEEETPAPEAEAKEPETPKPEPVPEFEITIDEALYDSDLVDQFKAMKSHYDRQIKNLNDQLSTMSHNAVESTTAKMFDKLDMPEKFGKGFVENESEEGRNRRRVIDEMSSLKAGYEANGKELPDEDVLVKKAINLVFGEQMANDARKAFSNKLRDRHEQRIARPNGRASKPSNRVAEATRNVAALMRDRGIGNGNDTFD